MIRDRIIGWGCMWLAVFSLAWATYELGSGSFRPGSFGGKSAVTSSILLGLFGANAPYVSGGLWLLLAIVLFVIGWRRLVTTSMPTPTMDEPSVPMPPTSPPRDRSHASIRRAFPKATRKPRRRRQGA